MKKIIVTSLVYWCVFLAAGLIEAHGQQKAMYFNSGEECSVALADGNALFYRPTYFGLRKRLGIGEEQRPLEADTCVRMLTVKGYQWVAQKEGEIMVFRGLKMIRREDCGNPITDVAPPKTAGAYIPPAKPQCPKDTYKSETPGICIKEKVTTNTITVSGPTVQVDKEVPVYPNCEEGSLYDTVSRQCVPPKKHISKYVWLGIGAGAMFGACEIGKFCGRKTRIITNTITGAPKIQTTINPRPPIGPNGTVIGGGTVPTRPMANFTPSRDGRSYSNNITAQSNSRTQLRPTTQVIE